MIAPKYPYRLGQRGVVVKKTKALFALAKRNGRTSRSMTTGGHRAAGTAWTGKDAKGEKAEIRYEWALGKSFLKETWTLYGDTGFILHGIDPTTGKEASWSFDNKGRIGKGVRTSSKDSEWTYADKGAGKLGPYSWRANATIAADKMRLDIKENILDGKAFPSEIITLTRKK